MPFFAKTFFHASNFQVSLISLLSGATSFLFVAALIYVGFPLKRGVQLSMALLALGAATMPFSPDLNHFLVSCALASLGMGVQPLLLTSTALADNQRARNISAFSAVLSLSILVGPLYISLISGLLHTDLLLSLLGIVPLTLLGLCAYGASAKSPQPKPAALGAKQIVRLLSNRTYFAGTTLMISYTLAFAAFTTYGAILATARGATELQAEIALSTFFGASLLTRILLAALDRRAACTLLFVCAAAGLATTALSQNLPQVVLGFVLLGTAHGLSYPLGSIYVAESVGDHELAAANMLLTAIDAATIFVSLPLLGYVAQNMGVSAVFLVPLPVTVALGLVFAKTATGSTKKSQQTY